MIKFQKKAFDEWTAKVDGHLLAKVRRTGPATYRVEGYKDKHLGTAERQIEAFDIVRNVWPEMA